MLGPEDSRDYVRAGGAIPLALVAGMEIDALAVCDDDGFPFLQGIELALSAVVRALDAGRAPALVLPNPDLVYPKGDRELGFTAGAIALLVEAALDRRFPALQLQFTRLGKPEPHLFAHAAGLLGIPPRRLVMIGDQLETDIAGARAAGIDAALLAGISRWEHARAAGPRRERGRAQSRSTAPPVRRARVPDRVDRAVIQRFCFVKLRDDEVARASRSAARVRAALAEAGVDATIGLPADASAVRWDLSIVIACPTLAAWQALAAHEAVAVALADVAARATVVKAWTFEAPD